MIDKYRKWIDENYSTYELSYGECEQATIKMQELFPELKRIRGHYYDTSWGEREHWWLIDENDEIIDPTAKQFPTNGRGVYVPWVEGDPEPTGKCLNCGGYVYNGDYCCSENCENEMIRNI